MSLPLVYGGGAAGVTRAAVNLSLTNGTPAALVAAVSGKVIRVLGLYFTVSADTLITLQSDATDLTGDMDFAANGILDWTAFRPDGYVDTASGEALNIEVPSGSANADVDGWIAYVTVNSGD